MKKGIKVSDADCNFLPFHFLFSLSLSSFNCIDDDDGFNNAITSQQHENVTEDERKKLLFQL